VPRERVAAPAREPAPEPEPGVAAPRGEDVPEPAAGVEPPLPAPPAGADAEPPTGVAGDDALVGLSEGGGGTAAAGGGGGAATGGGGGTGTGGGGSATVGVVTVGVVRVGAVTVTEVTGVVSVTVGSEGSAAFAPETATAAARPPRPSAPPQAARRMTARPRDESRIPRCMEGQRGRGSRGYVSGKAEGTGNRPRTALRPHG
jgi:hypothetical protein